MIRELVEFIPLRRLTKLTKMHKAGKLPPVDWLDRLSIAEVERIRERSKQSTNLQFLMVEFQQFKRSRSPVSVVYFEKNGQINNRMGFRSDIIRSVLRITQKTNKIFENNISVSDSMNRFLLQMPGL